jgi:hypothetical protein
LAATCAAHSSSSSSMTALALVCRSIICAQPTTFDTRSRYKNAAATDHLCGLVVPTLCPRPSV